MKDIHHRIGATASFPAVLSVRHKSPCHQLLNVKLIYFRLRIEFLPCYIFLTKKKLPRILKYSLSLSLLEIITALNNFQKCLQVFICYNLCIFTVFHEFIFCNDNSRPFSSIVALCYISYSFLAHCFSRLSTPFIGYRRL